jgi:uncharacterized peroxidase-related enzyme
MTWIRTIPTSEASEELLRAMEGQRALYPVEYSSPVHAAKDGRSAAIVEAHSLIPAALHHAFATFGVLMSPDLPLTRRQHEMVATVVSAANRCRLCSTAHAEFLRRLTLDDDLAEAIRRDFRSAPISDVDRAILEYAEQLTKDATRITKGHHERLRAVGLDNRTVLQITLIAAWFNYINRVADALGVGQD